MIAVLLALLAALTQAAPPPKGAIHGRVVERDTGRPLARAAVLLAVLDGSGEQRSTLTDERGAFAFDGLPAGRYDGLVTARGHEPHSIATGNAVVVASDRVVELRVAVPRTYAINVRVVDPFGDPLSRITVRALALQTGRSPYFSPHDGTDDLGRLRIFDLPPGPYVLCAEASVVGAPYSGGLARPDRLLRTCYPSSDEQDAEAVRIERADVDGVEIRMRRGRTFAIAGTVVDAAGAPSPIAMLRLERYRMNGTASLSVRVDAAGRFTIPNVEPGVYALEASIGELTGPGGQGLEQAAFVEVRLAGADADGILVALKKTVEVKGRFVPDDPAAPLPAAPGLTMYARQPAWQLPSTAGSMYAMARTDDYTFTLTGIFGPRLLEGSNLPGGWYVKSIRYRGREIIDTPTEFTGGSGAPPVEVVLSNRGALVSGTVVEDAGTPVRGAMVHLLRIGAREGRIEIAGWDRTSATGAFSFGPARGGEYVLVAMSGSSEVLSSSVPQDRLARLAALGERLTLSDLDERSAQLHLVRER